MKPAVGRSSERAAAEGKQRVGHRAKHPRPTSNAERELVLRVLQNLAACGVAEWTVLESGDIRLRLASGAVFDLDRDGVTRIA